MHSFLHNLESKVEAQVSQHALPGLGGGAAPAGAPAASPVQPSATNGQFFRSGYLPGHWEGRPYNLASDVTTVHNAMKGIGTREKDLLPVFCERPNAYLQDLRAAYHAQHHLDLLKRVQIETSGEHQRMFEALLGVKAELRAKYLYEAVEGVGSNEMLIVDCLLTCNNQEIEETKRAYKHHHLVPLQARVDFDTSGDFQKLVDAALTGSRPEDGIHNEWVGQDLITLFNATEGKTVGTDEKAIIGLIQQRSKAHLVFLNDAYKRKSKKGRTFVEEITAKQHGYKERAFVAYFLGPVGWTAFRINMELKGHIKADWEGLLRSLLLPTEDELKGAIRMLLQQYRVDLHERINHFFFGGELKEAMSRYAAFVDHNANDSGERAVVGDNSQEWVDPSVPPPQQGHASKLTKKQKVAVGIAVGVGAAALLGIAGGVAAYEINKQHKEQQGK